MSFMFHFLKPGDPYYSHWVNMRRRTRKAWLAVALWPPSTFLVSAIFRLVFGSDDLSFLLAALFTGCICFAFGLNQVAWPCPRCGNPFYRTLGLYWGWTNHCLHCGLPEYAPDGNF